MKQTLLASLKFTLLMTFLTGLIYPFLVERIGHHFFREKVEGSLVHRQEVLVGSQLIGQDFNDQQLFRGRPAGEVSLLGPTNKKLQGLIIARGERSQFFKMAETKNLPPELLLASGSGVDPHISPEAAYVQIESIVEAIQKHRAPAMDAAALGDQLREMIARHSEPPTWGLLGNIRINVLALNLELSDWIDQRDKQMPKSINRQMLKEMPKIPKMDKKHGRKNG
jgi:K+-transporting ATPase ATPase C chain